MPRGTGSGGRLARGGSQTTNFLVDGNRPYAESLIETSNGQVSRSQVFTPDGIGDLLQITRAGQGTLFGEGDAHGNLRGLSDSAGALVAVGDSDAWGAGASGNLGSYTPYAYTGEWQDPLTGLIYLRARDYEPGVGRLISTDAYPGDQRNPLKSNKYLYADLVPTTILDPSGYAGLADVGLAIETMSNLASVAVRTLSIYNRISTVVDFFSFATNVRDLVGGATDLELLWKTMNRDPYNGSGTYNGRSYGIDIAEAVEQFSLNA